MLQTIVLGPHIDLHTGIHQSLKTDPPPGVSYYQRGCRHHFLLESDPSDPKEHTPFAQPHLGEFVDLGPGPQVVHTCRWPVAGRNAWVTDMDDVGYPLLLGRYTINPSVEGTGGNSWSPELARCARQRARNMLTAYAHPSCKAILFRTSRAIEQARKWLQVLNLTDEGRPFLEKTQVLYPVQRPLLLPSGVRRKWADPCPLRVLFVGYDYQSKNGPLALRVFQNLKKRNPKVRFTYVGVIPDEDLPLAEGIDFRGHLPREEVLSLFRESHVLFHPSKGESFGMVFLEAAASGLAVVAARGPGLEHMDEIFGEREALLVDREVVKPADEEQSFEECLHTLLETPEKARDMGLSSYELAISGKFSVEHQHQLLAEAYQRAKAEPAEEGLSLNDLPYGGRWCPLSSDQVSRGQRSFCDLLSIQTSNFYIAGAGLRAALSA